MDKKEMKLLITRVNYYLLKEVYKPASGETNTKEFYKAVHLHPSKGRDIISDGSDYVEDNKFTQKLHKDTGISKNAILGIELLTTPYPMSLEEWESFFDTTPTDEEKRNRYIGNLLEKLHYQFSQYMHTGRPTIRDEDITDLFKWFFYLRTRKCFDSYKVQDNRIWDFQRVLEYPPKEIWKDCSNKTLDECIKSMSEHLETAKAMKIIRNL